MQNFWQVTPSIVTSATSNTMRRITEFEGLRAILAWWVVAAHLLQYCGFVIKPPHNLLFRVVSAGYAVDLFVILSGFVIFLVLDISPQKNYFQFMTERFFRIYPLYITMFIAAIVLMPLKIAVFMNGDWHNTEFSEKMLLQAQNAYNYFFSHLVSHVFLIQGLFPDQELPDSSTAFLGPAWSLSLEWQFYLIAPLLLFCLKRSLASFLVIAGGILCAQNLFSDLSFGYGAFLPLKMDFFVVGIFSYYVYKFSQTHFRFSHKIFPSVLTLSLIGVTLMLLSPHKILASRAIPLFIWLIVLSTTVAVSISPKLLPFKVISNFLNNRFLQDLGKVSYSTYLVHQLVFWILMWLTMMVFPDANKFTVLIVLGSVGSGSVIALSFGLYHWIEKPFIGIGKQVSKNISHAKAMPG